MRVRACALLVSLLVLVVTAFPSAALGATLLPPASREIPTIVTMRLGISAGDAIQQVERGTDQRALERIIPELFESATLLGVKIDAVSVGRGFWSEDGRVESENDLDLVVTGLRENVLALGATLGQRWGQSAVLAWEMQVESEMLTATLPLPDGTNSLDETLFVSLAQELTDGGHIRYAGADSLVFVAHTGDDTDDEFRVRMLRAKDALEAAGVRTGALSFGQAVMVELNPANYQRYVDGAVRSSAAPPRPLQPVRGAPVQAPAQVPAPR